jgi:hypothetical protein
MKKQVAINILKPTLIISIAIVMATLLVGMIAYSNCDEARLFMDNLFEKEVIIEDHLRPA